MVSRVKYSTANPITQGEKHHFFGYYDKSPWDSTGRYLLGLEADFMDRPPGPLDKAVIGLIDLGRNKWEVLATTQAWNWQQGCRLQWVGKDKDRLILYNDRQGGEFVAVIQDIHNGAKRILPRAVYDVGNDGISALSLDFKSLHQLNPGYGYSSLQHRSQCEPRPGQDGIWFMDLLSGEIRLVVSTTDIVKIEHQESMINARHWFNHIMFSPDQKRFAFLHRWDCNYAKKPHGLFNRAKHIMACSRRYASHLEYKFSGNHSTEGIFRLLHLISQRIRHSPPFENRMFTVNLDGSFPFCFKSDVSHFDWIDNKTILAYANVPDRGEGYYRILDMSDQITRIGEGILNSDGHCSFYQKSGWILTDTYPDKKNMQTLIIYNLAKNVRIDLGSYYSPPELRGEIRCDLHPRWSPNGHKICFDSAHQGTRQIYLIDIGEL